jgi:hypothetical protein
VPAEKTNFLLCKIILFHFFQQAGMEGAKWESVHANSGKTIQSSPAGRDTLKDSGGFVDGASRTVRFPGMGHEAREGG